LIGKENNAMSLENWISVIQLTMALAAAWCAARWWLTREPQIAARICLVGLVLSSALALFTLFGVPRPFSFHAESFDEAFEIDRTTSLAPDHPPPSSTHHWRANKEAAEVPANSGIELRLLGKRALHALRSLSTHSEDFPLLLGVLGVGIAVGVTIQVSLIAIGTWQLVRLPRTSIELICPATLARLTRLCECAGILNPPQLRVHPLAHGAFVSWLEPRVIHLPTSYPSWTSDELDAALAHELIHVVGHDGWWRYVSRVCTAVLWFHPGAWLVHHQLCLAQEVNADRLASQLSPNRDYLVGLAKLGLRLDGDQRSPSFIVSVFSKDLIRRIDMLKRTYTKSATANRRLAHGTLAAIAVICVASFCWTVDADESVRVASRAVDKLSQPNHVGFRKPKLEPWQVVPTGEAYAAIRVSEMREHEYLASFLRLADQFVAESLAGAGLDAASIQSLSDHGVRLQNIAAVQMNVDLTFSSHKTEATDEGGEKKVENRFSVQSHQAVIDTVTPINWTSVAKLLLSDRLTEMYKQLKDERVVDLAQLRLMLDRLANIPSDSKRQSIHTEPNCGDGLDSALANAWKTVDGGFVTVAINCQSAFKEEKPADTGGFFSMSHVATNDTTDVVDVNAPAVETQQDKLMLAVETEQRKLSAMMGRLGIGIDEANTPKDLELRVVCTPVAGTSVDELESQWDRFAAAANALLATDESKQELAEAVQSYELMTRLLNMECQRIGGDGSAMPAGILLSGTVPLP
jgi:BlaR1 peptidase M56